MYVYAHALEAAAITVFMVWLRAEFRPVSFQMTGWLFIKFQSTSPLTYADLCCIYGLFTDDTNNSGY